MEHYHRVFLAEGFKGGAPLIGFLDLSEKAHTHGACNVVGGLALSFTALDASAV